MFIFKYFLNELYDLCFYFNYSILLSVATFFCCCFPLKISFISEKYKELFLPWSYLELNCLSGLKETLPEI